MENLGSAIGSDSGFSLFRSASSPCWRRRRQYSIPPTVAAAVTTTTPQASPTNPQYAASGCGAGGGRGVVEPAGPQLKSRLHTERSGRTSKMVQSRVGEQVTQSVMLNTTQCVFLIRNCFISFLNCLIRN